MDGLFVFSQVSLPFGVNVLIPLLVLVLVCFVLFGTIENCLFSAVAEEAYCCGIRALEKVGNWSAAVSLLEEWREVDGYDTEKDAMVGVRLVGFGITLLFFLT